jgi:multiple sugar transport system permease protein
MNRRGVWLNEVLWFIPAAVLVLLVFVFPIARTLVLSFMHFNLDTGFEVQFAGFSNFIRLSSDSRFAAALKVTLLFTIVSVALEFVLGLLAALAVGTIRRLRSTTRVMLFIPWILPTAVIAALWIWIFNDQYGLVNALLIKLGLITSPIAWLGKPHTAFISIILADVWKAFPFVFIILLAGLQSIPREIYEAIDIDGGNAWHRFRYVTFPALLPFIFLALIFRFVQAFAIFDLIYVLTGGGPGGTTETVSVYGYYTYMRYLDFGYGAAQAIASVIALALMAWALYLLLLKRYEMGR